MKDPERRKGYVGVERKSLKELPYSVGVACQCCKCPIDDGEQT